MTDVMVRRFARWPVRPNWVLVDQCIVSGSKFAASVLVARFLGPDMFGTFVLMLAAQLYANAFQNALVISPMLVGAPRLDGSARADYLSGMFALQIMLSVLLALSLVILAFAWTALAPHASAQFTRPGNLISFVAALVAFQFQDWQRRRFFATGRSRSACASDMINYLPQTVLIALAAMSGQLSISLTFSIMAAASAASFLSGYVGDPVRPAFRHGVQALRREWRSCRDYLFSWQVMWVGTQGALLIATAFIGAQAIGGIRATQNVVGPFTALFQALDNVVPVNAARRFATSGVSGVVEYIRSTTARGTLALVPAMVAITLLRVPLTRLLYGDRYVEFASLLGWQAAFMLTQFYIGQLYYFFRAVSATRLVFVSCCVVALVSTLMTPLFAWLFRETGVVAALLCGSIAGLAFAGFLAARFLRGAHSLALSAKERV
jgi:O-antigen/teichoic acid export membrane protein